VVGGSHGPDRLNALCVTPFTSHAEEPEMPRTKSRRKPPRSRRDASLRDARIMEEIRHQRFVAFVRAIVGGTGAKDRR
jgi:hypothetical protein